MKNLDHKEEESKSNRLKTCIIISCLILLASGGYGIMRATSFDRAMSVYTNRESVVILESGDLGRFNIEYQLVFGMRGHRRTPAIPFLIYMERNRWGFWEVMLEATDVNDEGIMLNYPIFSNSIEIAGHRTVIVPDSGFEMFDLNDLPEGIFAEQSDSGSVIFWAVSGDQSDFLFQVTWEKHHDRYIFLLDSSTHLDLSVRPEVYRELLLGR